VVATVTFFLMHAAPGSPWDAKAIGGRRLDPALEASFNRRYGLDKPLGEQYVRWISNAARGELGFSFSHRRPVRDVLADALPRTMLLAGLSFALSFLVGVVVGVLQAERPGGTRDRWLGRVLLLLYSVPDFWLALVALLAFSYWLPLLPAGGIVDPVMHDYLSTGGRIADRLKHLVLPVVTLTLLSAASIARYQRSALLDVLPSDWMRTALAKGLSFRAAVRQHAVRNALLPTITLAGLWLPSLAAGTVFIEKVFSWPGMGLVTVNAIGARDYPLVTAGVLAISVLVVLGALLADLAVALVDPRVRLS